MTQPLILIAASGLGRETAEAVRASSAYELIGFVDDNEAKWGSTVDGLKVLGGLDAVASYYSDASLILCTGKGSSRRALADRLRAAGIGEERYATVIHPSVSIPDSCSVGAGGIVLANGVLTADVTVGRHVVCMPNVTLTHDDVIGDFATLCAAVTLGGSVHVGSAAYLGMAVSVREQVRIGAAAVIGMGSVVLSDVPASETWYGVPARSL